MGATYLIRNRVKVFNSILLGIFLIATCGNQQIESKDIRNECLSGNLSVYDSLISGNKKYGSDRKQICKSNFKCEPSEIRENVIIAPTWRADIFSDYVDGIKHVSGPTGHGYDINELSIGNKKVTYITTGVGACNVLDAVLALGCTPCKKILFIGSVGALDKNIEIGDVVVPEYSVCGVGADRYLTSLSVSENDSYLKKCYPNKELFEIILKSTDKVIANTDVRRYVGKTFSADTIFAQYAHLDEFINIGCDTIEMETATLFNSAHVAGIDTAAIFSVSDNTLANKSLYAGRTSSDQQRRARVKKDIIPKIVLNVLFG